MNYNYPEAEKKLMRIASIKNAIRSANKQKPIKNSKIEDALYELSADMYALDTITHEHLMVICNKYFN